ncbi:hypothetical protein JTF08_13775 [Micrococcaceae bacterium RIT802]|nr:hypothetical protein [Micrococcaceae bacterium RIT 802]
MSLRSLKPHGPRGVMLLGFALLALTMGYAYAGRPDRGGTLAWLDHVIPIPVFGYLWILVGGWLTLSAFRVNQSRALGAFSGMCFLWAMAYAISGVINLANGEPPRGFTLIPAFLALTIACAAATRMVNPASSHVEVVVKPGPRPTDGGTDDA